MIGASDHSRMRRMTSFPSMSGKPRSRMITSLALAAIWESAASPVAAVSTA